MGKLVHNGITYAQVNRGLDSGVRSLKDCYLIGYSASEARHSPIDANNYIEVVGNDVVLHRNNSIYDTLLYVPTFLTAGDICTISFDSVTNTDKVFYVQYGSSITDDPLTFTRIMAFDYTSYSSYIRGITFTAPADGYYNVAFWSNNMNDVIVSNPRYVIYS